MASIPSDSPPTHVVLFPFMSKGHTIPLLHLARLLLLRNAAVTIFTTPLNRPFISDSLSDTTTTAAAIISLSFPENVPDIPAGVESTDKLPSMSLLPAFALATRLMKPSFEKALKGLPDVTFVVSDGFLGWTLESATQLGIPRLVFYGTSNYAMALGQDVSENRLLYASYARDEPFALKSFPSITISKNYFDPLLADPDPESPNAQSLIEALTMTSKSYGLITNSFSELEPQFVDYWNRNSQPKSWCVGPLCLAEPLGRSRSTQNPNWVLQWLDQKLEQGRSVLYVAFGSQAEITVEQLREIATGLEESGVDFLWVVRETQWGVLKEDGFEERLKSRGLVARGWVNQREVLEHESVQGFLSHCGWNSVMESVCAKVPILGWPLGADQPMNAKMVEEEIGVGLRVAETGGGGFVKWEDLKRMVRELMVGEKGKVAREKVKEVGGAAVEAVEEGGSSWRALNELIDEVHERRRVCSLGT